MRMGVLTLLLMLSTLNLHYTSASNSDLQKKPLLSSADMKGKNVDTEMIYEKQFTQDHHSFVWIRTLGFGGGGGGGVGRNLRGGGGGRSGGGGGRSGGGSSRGSSGGSQGVGGGSAAGKGGSRGGGIGSRGSGVVFGGAAGAAGVGAANSHRNSQNNRNATSSSIQNQFGFVLLGTGFILDLLLV